MVFEMVLDEILGGFLPVLAYWFYSGLYLVLDPYLDKYRIHTKEEERKNTATRLQVIKSVLMAQAMGVSFSLLAFMVKAENTKAEKSHNNWSAIISQIIVAVLVRDLWQYSVHRVFHSNKFLYRHIHSNHRRIIVSYTYAAQYNHPVEAFCTETLGATISFLASGMSPRTAAFLFTFTAVKGMEDHCGFYIPWNPFHLLFENNCMFHDVHHQVNGLKYNIASPFFAVRDRLFGTYLPYEVKKRDTGGYI